MRKILWQYLETGTNIRTRGQTPTQTNDGSKESKFRQKGVANSQSRCRLEIHDRSKQIVHCLASWQFYKEVTLGSYCSCCSVCSCLALKESKAGSLVSCSGSDFLHHHICTYFKFWHNLSTKEGKYKLLKNCIMMA